MIEALNLSKEYGAFSAVRDLSFSVSAGQVVGFLGPNGAGKTTTLRMLAGFLGPSRGTVRVLGHDVSEEPMRARRAIGYMPEAAPLYPEMRVAEYLAFRAALKLVPRRERKLAVQRAMDLSRVADMRNTVIGHLSKGYRQRVGLADALVSNPPLLILDEPTAGLDPNQIREVRELIHSLAREHTVLLSTHILSEVEAICERALVLHQGQLVAEGPIGELLRHRQSRRVYWELRDAPGVAKSLLESLGAKTLSQVEASHSQILTLETEWTPDVSDVELQLEKAVTQLVEHQVGVRRVETARAKLEEVFSALTEAQPTPLPDRPAAQREELRS